jgi:hypothetical protein
VGGWSAVGTGETHAIERLLRQAAGLGLRAPELTVVLGERAAALAEAAGSDKLWVRAESLIVSARVRLGLRAATVGRAVAALRAAEDLGETVLAAGLRTDLTVCARSVGVPLTGLAALRPALGAEGFSGAAKAAALCQLVGCLSQFGRKPELDRTLAEADRLCGADDDLDGDGRLLARALLRVGVSSHRRRHADIMGAADAARTGLGYLEQLDDPGGDGGVVRVRLIVQLVCSLLDRGDTENALEIARPVLAEPERAASVAPLGWLRMAMATRILLPSGAVEAAAGMLRDGVHSTERRGLHALTARLWTELAHVEEKLGRPAETIECLHHSRAAEHLYARARRQATGLLSGEFGTGGHAAIDLDEVLDSAPRTLAAPVISRAERATPWEPEPAAWDAQDGQPASAAKRAQSTAAVSLGEPVLEVGERVHAVGERALERRESGRDTAESMPLEPTESRRAGGNAELEAGEPRRRVRESELGSTESGLEAGEPTGGVRESGLEPTGRRGGSESGLDVGDSGLEVNPAQPSSHGGHVRSESGSAESVGKRGRSGAGVQAEATDSKPGVGLAPIRIDTPAVTGLPLAPPPADEPAPRVRPSLERAQESVVASEQWRTEREAKATTRHDSEHGSVAARSVLDRLGISAGSNGGRRRAADSDPTAEAPKAERTGSTAQAPSPAAGPGREPAAGLEPERTAGTAREATAAAAEPESTTDGSGREPTAAGSGRGSTAPGVGWGSAAVLEPESAVARWEREPIGTASRSEPNTASAPAQVAGTPDPERRARVPESERRTGTPESEWHSGAPELGRHTGVPELEHPTTALEAAHPAGTPEHPIGLPQHPAALPKRIVGMPEHLAAPPEYPTTGTSAQGEPDAAQRKPAQDAVHHQGPAEDAGQQGPAEAAAQREPADAAGWRGPAEHAVHHQGPAEDAGQQGPAEAATQREPADAAGWRGAEEDAGPQKRAEDTGQREPADEAAHQGPAKDTAHQGPADDDGKQEPPEKAPSVPVNENWLPRLRLPPSLEPFEDFTDEALAASETHFTNTPAIEDGGFGEPFRVARSGSSTEDDDLPPDAGLADLLARALAEHQAGTSSAAALVKRLGQGSGDPRPVNGHGRNGEAPSNGRHRTDG